MITAVTEGVAPYVAYVVRTVHVKMCTYGAVYGAVYGALLYQRHAAHRVRCTCDVRAVPCAVSCFLVFMLILFDLILNR